MASVNEIDALLPQTQCGECGYEGCLPYAEAIANGYAGIDQCPPGGTTTFNALARLLKTDTKPFIKKVAQQTRPPSIATIRSSECIGCTKCIPACPVDAIIGSGKQLHAVIEHECTGCGLCVDPCPVDCIDMVPCEQPTYHPQIARNRHQQKKIRTLKREHEHQQAYRKKRHLSEKSSDKQAKKDFILQALSRVKAKHRHE